MKIKTCVMESKAWPEKYQLHFVKGFTQTDGSNEGGAVQPLTIVKISQKRRRWLANNTAASALMQLARSQAPAQGLMMRRG